MPANLNNAPLSSDKVLVTGANGFIGRPLCAALIKKQGSVKAAVRNADGLTSNRDTVAIGSIDGATDWSIALQGIEVVVHLAARVHVMQDQAVDPLAEFRKVNVAALVQVA